MKARQFRYAADNLGYLICGDTSAIAVDGGAAADILSFLEKSGLRLSVITNTHGHGDHTCGNAELMESTGARYLPASELPGIGELSLDGSSLEIIHTPGHTGDSVCFRGDGFLLSGDTLFNGKVGRCFTGDTKTFYDSIERILSLPGDTVVYGGHDYVEEYMEFARTVEPSNPHIDGYLLNYHPEHVHATLEEERKVDPFLRLDQPSVVSFLKKRGLPASTRLQRFTSLLEWGRE
ncbi:MAG: MBL fold metallo-hydrolase [Candidatus Aegiribacteria sp.]